ncbi:MAG: hypothetical protein DRO88_10005 [Promethearchaeia archaeon]|nr:MAG: hypothetical protein DRO88_10005 [Candidatus Lokiarchaeia archaeon]
MNNLSQNSDSEKSKFDPRPPFHFECLQCGNCCSDENTIVNLTYSDILRIQWELNLSYIELLDIVGFYMFSEPMTKEQKDKMVLPHIETQNGPAFLGLRKKDDGTCIFLNKNKKCKIYAARPDICRTFPFHFHSSPHKEQMEKMDITMVYAAKAIEYCPGIRKSKHLIDNTKWMAIGKATIKNIFKDSIFIERWNKAVKNNKIKPFAENYLKIIADFSETSPDNPKKREKKKISYKQRIRKKIPK